jgi:hypothetical protein
MVKATHLDDPVDVGTLTASAARSLDARVVAGLNVLVAGGTRAGKTTTSKDTLPKEHGAGRHRRGAAPSRLLLGTLKVYA